MFLNNNKLIVFMIEVDVVVDGWAEVSTMPEIMELNQELLIHIFMDIMDIAWDMEDNSELLAMFISTKEDAKLFMLH